jgi:hypothetical protein
MLDAALGLDEILLVLMHVDLSELSRCQRLCKLWRDAASYVFTDAEWQRSRVTVHDVELMLRCLQIDAVWAGCDSGLKQEHSDTLQCFSFAPAWVMSVFARLCSHSWLFQQ